MVNEMEERGHETVAILPKDSGIADWYHDSGLETRFLWSSPIRRRRSPIGQVFYLFRSLVAVVSLVSIIVREDIDAVHVNEIKYPHGLLAGKIAGVATVCHVRAYIGSSMLRRLLGGYVALLSDEIVCVSERTREYIFHDVGIQKGNIGVIHDAVPSPERFEGISDSSDFRKMYGVDEDSFLVVQVSKLARLKGQERLLDVARLVEETTEKVEFCIVGGEIDGHESYATELRSRAKDIDSVHMVGFHPDVIEVFAAADVVVHLPRHEDPFPGVVLEGMLAGKPVIGSNSGGIPEQIDVGETGFIVPKEGNADKIAEYILRLYEDEQTREQMGRMAYERVRERFPVDGYFDEIERLYSNLPTS